MQNTDGNPDRIPAPELHTLQQSLTEGLSKINRRIDHVIGRHAVPDPACPDCEE